MNFFQTSFKSLIALVTSAKSFAAAATAFIFLFATHPALAQFKQQGQKLVGNSVVIASQQGQSVALAADNATAIVGGIADNSYLGAAWVFTKSGGVWTQQTKLSGTGAVGVARQGGSVALSSDGNTAIVGGYADHSFIGAVWIFTRSGGVWTQQGSKLTASDAVSSANFGYSVALSSDGNTALVGGYNDADGFGAAWVFTRSNGVWTQQGSKLVGSTVTRLSEFGASVALDSDGNTAVMGGPGDNAQAGAVWIYTRSGSVWTQQGSKLVGTGAVGNARLGESVAIAGEGDVLIAGGDEDNSNIGATWVFAQSGGVWTQQGPKLVGSGAAGASLQGFSVAMPFDGRTALIGGAGDNSNSGAAWVFTQSGGNWTQLGSKLAGSDAQGAAEQGISVALSPDGALALVGGPSDNSSIGAAWVFSLHDAAATHDFDGNSKSDILWRSAGGDVAMWLMSGATVSSSISVGNVVASWSVAGQRDFDADSSADILWRDSSGNVAIWLMNAGQISSSALVGNVPTTWSIAGTGDFNGDARGDILWRNSGGDVAIWLMNGGTITASVLTGNVPASWSIAGTGDFNGDGKTDILWRDSSGNVAIWLMNGGTVSSSILVGNVPVSWTVVGTGDLSGDGKTDIIWRDTGGNMAVWFMSGGTVLSSQSLGNVPTSWSIAETGDFNGDGKSDILWRDTSGNVAMWLMSGSTVSSSLLVANVPTVWTVQGTNAD